jgi:L-alanine-DL-glutamate epimerase-like enolase superfamily enzyme
MPNSITQDQVTMAADTLFAISETALPRKCLWPRRRVAERRDANDGMLTAADRSGAGVSWNMKAVEKYAVTL